MSHRQVAKEAFYKWLAEQSPALEPSWSGVTDTRDYFEPGSKWPEGVKGYVKFNQDDTITYHIF